MPKHKIVLPKKATGATYSAEIGLITHTLPVPAARGAGSGADAGADAGADGASESSADASAGAGLGLGPGLGPGPGTSTTPGAPGATTSLTGTYRGVIVITQGSTLG